MHYGNMKEQHASAAMGMAARLRHETKQWHSFIPSCRTGDAAVAGAAAAVAAAVAAAAFWGFQSP